MSKYANLFQEAIFHFVIVFIHKFVLFFSSIDSRPAFKFRAMAVILIIIDRAEQGGGINVSKGRQLVHLYTLVRSFNTQSTAPEHGSYDHDWGHADRTQTHPQGLLLNYLHLLDAPIT